MDASKRWGANMIEASGPSSRPLVSLCCSTYSRPDLFELSLKGLLRQTYEPLEIVVLVDGANASSLDVLAAHPDPRLRWFTTPKPSGMVPAWNKVVGASKGKYFLFCADDDVLLDHAIDAQVDILEANPKVGYCHADFFFINDEGEQIGVWQSHEGTWIRSGLSEWGRYLRQTKACMQTAVVRRTLWDEVGGWDEDAGYPGDNSLYLKLLRISDVGHAAQFACQYRIRTRSPDSWLKNTLKVKDDVALARKHLADPPEALRDTVEKLREITNNDFSRRALVVLADRRATAAERADFISWVDANLFQSSGLRGTFYRWLVERRLEGLPAAASHLDLVARGFARTALTSLRRVLPSRAKQERA